MTNVQIIASYMQENNIEEPIHTFQKWKELGFSVKKGEKSQDRITIWKYSSKKKADEDQDVEDGHCFMKTACFFRLSQVEPIKG